MNNQLLTLTAAIITTLKELDVSQAVELKPVYTTFDTLCREHLSLTCEPPAILTKGFNTALSAVFSSGQSQTATLKMREDCKALAIERLETGLKHGKPLALYAGDIKEFEIKPTVSGKKGAEKTIYDIERDTVKEETAFTFANFVKWLPLAKEYASTHGIELKPFTMLKAKQDGFIECRAWLENDKAGKTDREYLTRWQGIEGHIKTAITTQDCKDKLILTAGYNVALCLTHSRKVRLDGITTREQENTIQLDDLA